MIKVILILLAIYFGVILYGEARQGHWNDAGCTVLKLVLVAVIWITK